MSDKVGLASLIDEVTAGVYPSAAVKMRNRVGVDGRFLQRRRSLTTPQDLAKFIILLFASIPHVGAAAAAERVCELRNPVHEDGGEHEWHWMHHLTFLETLTKLIEEIQQEQRQNLLGISICATHPEAAIYFIGANGVEEAYRFYDGRPHYRFQATMSDFRDISALLIYAVALYGSANSVDEGGDGSSSDADAGEEAGTSEPNGVPTNKNAAPGRAALVQPGLHPTGDYYSSPDNSVSEREVQSLSCTPAGQPRPHDGVAGSMIPELSNGRPPPPLLPVA
jgi:hypothetical protein